MSLAGRRSRGRRPSLTNRGGPGVADEEGSDDQLELVDEIVGQELGVHVAAAFDHQPLHAAFAEILAEAAHLDPRAAVDDGRHGPQPRASVEDRGLAQYTSFSISPVVKK